MLHLGLPQSPRTLICYASEAPDNAVFRNAFVDALTAKKGKAIKIVDDHNNDVCDFSSNAFDPEQAIAEASRQDVKSIYLGPSINDLDKAIQMALINRGRLLLFGSPSLYTKVILDGGEANINGLVLVAPWNPDAYPDNPFSRNALSLWNATVNWRTATAYDATRVVIAFFKAEWYS